MSVATIGQDDFLPPRLIEEYPGLAPHTVIEVRKNDVDIPVGTKGVVLRTVPETGNYQCAVKIAGTPGPRVVALTHDQVRPIGKLGPNERPKMELLAMAHDPSDPGVKQGETKKKTRAWTQEQREAQSRKLKEYNSLKKGAASVVEQEVAASADKAREQIAEKMAPKSSPSENQLAAAAENEIAAFKAVKEYRERHTPRPLGSPADWMAEAADAVRQVLGRAAGGASAAELRALLSLIEMAEGAA